NLSEFSGSLLAHKKGHPPAVLTLPGRDGHARSTDKDAHRHCELILPAKGGCLEVAVLTGAWKPMAGATVQLAGGQMPHLYNGTYVGAARGPERDQVEPILYPTATTDADGIARFQDLVPGVYRIYASSGDGKTARDVREGIWHD